MNKEEIEKAKEHYIFTTKHILDDSNKRLKEYIKYLEQKESILDKVTDKLKEDIDFLEFSRDRDIDNCYREDEEDRAVRVYIESILNIIEGEKK